MIPLNDQFFDKIHFDLSLPPLLLPLLDSIVQVFSLCTVLKEICTLLGIPVTGLILGDPVCLWNGELSLPAASAVPDPLHATPLKEKSNCPIFQMTKESWSSSSSIQLRTMPFLLHVSKTINGGLAQHSDNEPSQAEQAHDKEQASKSRCPQAQGNRNS